MTYGKIIEICYLAFVVPFYAHSPTCGAQLYLLCLDHAENVKKWYFKPIMIIERHCVLKRS